MRYERVGAVAWITLNRPSSSNAIDQSVREGLQRSFAAVEDDDEVRVVVLTGEGRAFCAGVDLKEARTQPQPLDLGMPVSEAVESCSRPVVAGVNGAAVGGGFELALAADVRVAAASAFFTLTELRIGSLPGSGGTQRLFTHLPPAVAWKALLTGDRMSAAQAQHHGLVSDVFDDDGFRDELAALADRIAAAAPLSLRAAKLAGRAALEDRMQAGLRLERVLWNALAGTEDRQEGRAAFREKRPPEFRGR